MLHLAAVVVLILFSASHFAFLLIANPEASSRNTVFPFVTSNFLFFLTAIFELFTAYLAYRYRGRDLASVLILTFIGIILTYRWAFYLTDGRHCGCLGLLGRLLHVNKNWEQLIPRLALLILTAATIPWICRVWHNYLVWLRGKVTIVVLILIPTFSYADGSTIVVHGEYDGAVYNPTTGDVYNDKRQIQATFSVRISGQLWKICTTNSNTGAVGELWYDGKDTYIRETQVMVGYPPSNVTFAAISSSPLFMPFNDDQHLAILWLAYSFSPSMVPKSGTLPIPWNGVRNSISAFGYRWDVTPSADGRFASKIIFVLNHKLLLSEKEELLRPEFVYPTDRQDMYNSLVKAIKYRKLMPEGFVRGTYECTEWFLTNGISIPKNAKLTSNYSGLDDFKGKRKFIYPSMLLNLNARSMEVNETDIDILPQVAENMKVVDFRYKKTESSRVYNGSFYDLKAGDKWKSDHDPTLLAEQANYLKHGPKVNDSGIFIGYKNYLVWLLFAVLIAIPAMAILKQRKQKEHQ